MYTKIVGYILLALGVLIILWTLFASYNIFTGKAQAYEMFKVQEKKEEVKKEVVNNGDINEMLQSQMQNLIGDQFENMIPQGSTEIILNLSVWTMLAFLLMSGGSKFASIGIKLIK